MQAREIKMMLLGPRCGKTTFVQNLQKYNAEYSPTTVGVQVTPYDIGCIGHEKYRLQLWEVGSAVQGLGQGYCMDADLALIFQDDTDNHRVFETWVQGVPKIYVQNYTPSDMEQIINRIRLVLARSKL